MPNDEFDEVEAEVLRRAGAGLREAVAVEDRPVAARLVARLYGSLGSAQRSSLLSILLRPLSPLALVAVASGAFASYLGRGAVTTLDDLGRFTSEQIFELARFVEQVSPEALRSVAFALSDARAEMPAFAAAAALLLLRTLDLAEPAPSRPD